MNTNRQDCIQNTPNTSAGKTRFSYPAATLKKSQAALQSTNGFGLWLNATPNNNAKTLDGLNTQNLLRQEWPE